MQNANRPSDSISTYPPLIQAVLNNDIEKVTALLDAGTPVDQLSDAGKTALFYALEYQKYDDPYGVYDETRDRQKVDDAITLLLIERGADVNINNDSYPFLCYVLRKEAVFMALLNAGADIHAFDYDTTGWMSILHSACQANSKFAVEALVKRGANPNLRFALNQMTPLFYAGVPNIQYTDNPENIAKQFEENYAIIEFLLRNGADPELKDKRGRDFLFSLQDPKGSGLDCRPTYIRGPKFGQRVVEHPTPDERYERIKQMVNDLSRRAPATGGAMSADVVCTEYDRPVIKDGRAVVGSVEFMSADAAARALANIETLLFGVEPTCPFPGTVAHTSTTALRSSQSFGDTGSADVDTSSVADSAESTAWADAVRKHARNELDTGEVMAMVPRC